MFDARTILAESWRRYRARRVVAKAELSGAFSGARRKHLLGARPAGSSVSSLDLAGRVKTPRPAPLSEGNDGS